MRLLAADITTQRMSESSFLAFEKDGGGGVRQGLAQTLYRSVAAWDKSAFFRF